jgi:hypothetical protein
MCTLNLAEALQALQEYVSIYANVSILFAIVKNGS